MSSRAVIALAVLAAVLLARFWPSGSGRGDSARSGDRMAAVVTRAVDGDTIHVRDSSGRDVAVRLLGIDTPETHRPGTPVECGGREASASMARPAPPGAAGPLAADPP